MSDSRESMDNSSHTSSAQFDAFSRRHIGPRDTEVAAMLNTLGLASLKDLVDAAVPSNIRLKGQIKTPPAQSEKDALAELRGIAEKNKVFRSFIGQGYYNTVVPAPIQRNILENPGWYTQYTPYQAEISQGRLEALLNFQTMIAELTGLEVANASLLDEGTAAAEAMAMAFSSRRNDAANLFFISDKCFAQTISVVKTRAEPLGIEVVVGDCHKVSFDNKAFGVLLQYPDRDGTVPNYSPVIERAKASGLFTIVAADILALCLIKTPGELGVDIAVGSTQRFGVPVGFGGPHAGYMATRDELKRKMPGRIVGVSKDREGRNAIRLALQTREQHIRREKATSNICTAQVLLAVMAGMYAVYHGPEGLKSIASQVHGKTNALAAGLKKLGYSLKNSTWFDTLTIVGGPKSADQILAAAISRRINFAKADEQSVSVSLDETVTDAELLEILSVFGEATSLNTSELAKATAGLPGDSLRSSPPLKHPIFTRFHSETELMRYIRGLEAKDLSLTSSMIPLGSCTMKLNAASELFPVSWNTFNSIHPFAPKDQTAGYKQMISELERDLSEITGFNAVSLQPNSGSQGEYAGLLVIRKYLRAKGQGHRNVCLIPQSAHGTNPASAVLAGMKVVVTGCDKLGNIDLKDLEAKAAENAGVLAAFMITYPSTHGVFEESIKEICDIIHRHGGQVYMDGANMNAQVGLCRPGDFGPDVCHLNLHKTFSIPHGGGGPGVGPIGVKSHLAPYLPGHPVLEGDAKDAIGPVSAAPFGSASILPIPWMYIRMMGPQGLKRATEVAILNANYIATRLHPHFPVLYRGNRNLVAHECIVDLRQFKATTGVEVEDVAKRLMDYGFHAPTVSFPVPGTLMIEPTESESKAELDRFCDAMISIRKEIDEIAAGKADKKNNCLKNAPHTASMLVNETWDYPYSREKAVFPAAWVKDRKFWPPVARIDNALGDRNLICTCPSVEDYA